MHPAPESKKNFDRLKDLLREMFQLDRGDLDFGLYRIMNMKAAEIETFLDEGLLPQVQTVLAGVADEQRTALDRAVAEAKAKARELGVDPETTPAVVKLKKQLAEASADAQTESDVYGHLANFFARYYDEGDFMSLRRYSGGGQPTYLIPYDGEEVKLHWANADQYYVKTTENYSSYAFMAGEGDAAFRVRFDIAAADNVKDNVKEASDKQRRFVLAEDAVMFDDSSELCVRFEHRPLTEAEKQVWGKSGARQQDRIDADTADRVLAVVERLDPTRQLLLAAPAPTDADRERTLLAKHVERYTAKNSFDYFIHKDLGGFLRRELDLYLKTDLLDLGDLARGDEDRLSRALARMRAVREISDKLIAFLAQLEDFQRRLWLKKKFVLETQWCVTLDRVPESLYPEIVANEAQRKEWQALFAVDDVEADLGSGATAYSTPLTPEFLCTNPYLVVDTCHFNGDFKERLLAALSQAGPLDEQADGLLIRGENFQAINLLQTRYFGQIKCMYIDPPYNTDASAILYKNNYKDSSWLSLVFDRISLAHNFLASDGILCVAIDDEESSFLRTILKKLFERELGIVPVRSNPAGRKSRDQFSPTHEYAFFFGKQDAVPGSLKKTKRELARYPHTDEIGRYAWNNLVRHGSGDRRQDRPTMFYPIYVSKSGQLRVPAMQWNSEKEEYKILEEAKEGETTVWPVKIENGRSIEKRWHRGPEAISSKPSDYRIRRDKESGDIDIDFKIRIDLGSMPKTWWDNKNYASANRGPKVLKEMFGSKVFDFSKAVNLVEDCLQVSRCVPGCTTCDFFGGSGTTGHAVINLNRGDSGRRKYILVEMGEYFDTVMLPRLKKAVYSPDWKAGKPASRDKGVSQLIRYVRLESYEDTLDGLVVTPQDGDLLAGKDPLLAEDYKLRYALGAETAGSPCLLGRDFTDPFAYTLSVVRDGVRRETPVDLPETFNLLLGLRVESRRCLDGVLAMAGEDPEGQSCLVLWRNLDAMGNKALESWFRTRRSHFPDQLDVIYVNGDHTLGAVRHTEESWTAQPIEPLFRELMFAADTA